MHVHACKVNIVTQVFYLLMRPYSCLQLSAPVNHLDIANGARLYTRQRWDFYYEETVHIINVHVYIRSINVYMHGLMQLPTPSHVPAI